MGLFDTKYCAVCNNKKGLFGYKLKDGTHLCRKCGKKFAYDDFVLGVTYHRHRELSDITMQQYEHLVGLREENLQELAEFDATKTFCGFIQIDEHAQEITFLEKVFFENMKDRQKYNPPVFKFEKLAFVRIITTEPETSTTVTGGAKAESKVRLLLGFVDPVYDIICLDIGKITSKTGMFGGIKTKMSPEIEKLTEVIDSMVSFEIDWSLEHDMLTPASDMDAYWRMAKRAKDLGYLQSEDIKDILQSYCGKDRAKIREIKKTYGL